MKRLKNTAVGLASITAATKNPNETGNKVFQTGYDSKAGIFTQPSENPTYLTTGLNPGTFQDEPDINHPYYKQQYYPSVDNDENPYDAEAAMKLAGYNPEYLSEGKYPGTFTPGTSDPPSYHPRGGGGRKQTKRYRRRLTHRKMKTLKKRKTKRTKRRR
jgi:hypothetical protein